MAMAKPEAKARPPRGKAKCSGNSKGSGKGKYKGSGKGKSGGTGEDLLCSDSDDFDYDPSCASSEDTSELPWEYSSFDYDESRTISLGLKYREQEKKDRGEKYLTELQQQNALMCLKVLEEAKEEQKGSSFIRAPTEASAPTEIRQHTSSSSSK